MSELPGFQYFEKVVSKGWKNNLPLWFQLSLDLKYTHLLFF